MQLRNVLAAGATFALIGSAAAETLPMVPQTGVVALSDFFYISVGGTVQVIETPKFNYGRNFDLIAIQWSDAFAERPRVVTGGPALAFGYNLPWENLGLRPRIELAAQANFGMARVSTFSTAPIGLRFTYYTGLNDGSPIGLGVSDTQDIALRMTYANADSILRFKTDFALGSRITLTPSVGAVVGFTQTKYDLTSRSNVAGLVDFTNHLRETMTSWRGGAELALDATISLGETFKLHGGINGAAYYQHVRIAGRDCFGSSLILGQDACPPLSSVSLGEARASDGGLGARAGASLGATMSLGWMNITVMGMGSYNINTPQIENPRYPEQPQKGTKVGWEDRFSYGGYIMATFPLN